MQQYVRNYLLRIKPYFPTLRLAASYLGVIMVMSLSFSFVLFHTGAQEIGRQIPNSGVYSQMTNVDQDIFDTFFQARIDRGRHELIARLTLLNIFVLLGGAAVSYVLARRTLEPIEEAMAAQARFASDASHELRTPLAAIQTENEVALRNPKLSLSRSKEILASNLEEVTRLQALSDGLLRLARQDNQEIELRAVNISDIAGDAINQFIKPAQQKNIAIEDKVRPVSALADHNGLVQIVGILLDNAIKYSPAKTSVWVEGGTRNKQAYLSVRDEGPGIHRQDMPHIFDRFYRADSSRTSQQVSGHGLGLALAETIAENMGGAISVKTKMGKGSTFTITLPLA